MSTPSVFARRETATDLAANLRSLEVSLQEQLAAMSTTSLDEVATAHRATVERNLSEVCVAQRRLAEGIYGYCMSCADPISIGRLEVRPWATRCTRCAERPRW